MNELLQIIKDKVMPFVYLKEKDRDVWDNGFRTGEVVHKYYVYDIDLYECKEVTKEEFEMLKAFKEGKHE